MNRKNKIIVAVIVAALSAVGLYTVNRYYIVPAGAKTAAENEAHPLAPQFTVEGIFGRKISLAQYRGKVVILDFWATWCGPCRLEIPGFVKLQNRYGSRGLQIIGISMDDSVQPVLAFYKQFHLDYPVAIGNDKLAELYGGIVGIPTTFLIGRDGHIYDKLAGVVDESQWAAEIKRLLATPATAEALNFKPDGE